MSDLSKPDVLCNAIMGALYDVLTNGDATVPKSSDNFFSWCTPGIPVDANDFRFLAQGVDRGRDSASSGKPCLRFGRRSFSRGHFHRRQFGL